MKKNLLIVALAAALIPSALIAQPQPRQQMPQAPQPEYKFTVVKENPITSVKNQNSSGTCWCFSTISFLESEIIRIKGIKDAAQYPDLSEMFVVGQSYKDRAEKFVRLNGQLNFGAGSEADDVLDVIRDYGIVPQEAMPGKQALPVHGELDAVTKAYVEAIAKKPNRTLSENWKSGFDAVVDNFLGVPPTTFEVNGKTYTPASYRDELGIVPDDYVTITSFTHHPFYTKFAIEVSDNWRWDTAYNVPLDEFMQILKEAIEKGYTAAWGSDVSEAGFSRTGVARLVDTTPAIPQTDQQRLTGNGPAPGQRPVVEIPKEIVPTQEWRQKGFDEQTTTDDHGMHIFGMAKDQEGTLYYMVKNSWGESGNYKGIYYASENFVAGKSMDIVVHKDALSKDIKKKLGIK
ncbi:MAG: aminopeptidase [Bacteroidales bacterium]|nr:aminopeptidase [Bacteroidales bacterium]